MKTRLVPTSVHGRVLISDPAQGPVRGALVGFHGYGQNADLMLDELRRIPGADEWRLVSIQALHPFYTRNDQAVVASWMTRQDREAAIADNISYVNRAIAETCDDAVRTLVCLGFSQGASMAARAAVRGNRRVAGLVMLGGDIPPDVKEDPRAVLPPVLIGVGSGDSWYQARVDADLRFLESRGLVPRMIRFAGGHEFTDEFRTAVGEWLGQF